MLATRLCVQKYRKSSISKIERDTKRFERNARTVLCEMYL
jgi:hypothetical protein